ncbi:MULTISPECIES: EAL and HDOD domain-containing protein [Halomonadaceae]|uniref:EAL and HDOD domain-containing protein n=1 Tax=Halomonadaceae TaxID=28256 RepID=UPI00159A34D0|nr:MULTISPECIES: HDOD domain-containing protein [Halomonas]QJQ94254.1 HDOD domain-containing protein [Halomonas sp. PA5]
MLYRNDQGLSVLEVGEEIATAEVIYHLSTAISRRVGFFKAPAFINVTAEFLLSRHCLPLPPEHVVFELVERITPTPALVEAVRLFRQQGYRFALDDFAFMPEWYPLLPLASYIKVDIMMLSPSEAMSHRQALAKLPVKWIAERIETREERDAYLDIGFDFFQGYFYARPTPIYGRKIPSSTLQTTLLLNALWRPEPNAGKIISLIQSDPALAMKLTRIANSAYYRQHDKIRSMHDVVARLGFRQLSSWVAIIGLLGNVPSEHANLVLTRAKACELLAQQEQLSGSNAYFIGLLSATELLLGIPSEEFLDCLELDTKITAAILLREGAYGNVLKRIEATERLYAMRQLASHGEDPRLYDIYLDARHAAFELLTALSPNG